MPTSPLQSVTLAEQNKKELQTEPVLTQISDVQHSPFTPPQIAQRPDINVLARANLLKQYVPAQRTGYYPFLLAQQPYVDDISQQFGLKVYENMLKDPVVYASARLYPLAMIANGYELVPSLSRDETDYDIAKAMCNFVQKCLDELETQYDVVLEQHVTSAFAFGSAIAEQNFKIEEFGSDFSELGSGSKLLRLSNLRDLPLENAIHIVDSYNHTVGIMTQRWPGQVYPAGSYIPIDFSAITNMQGMKPTDDPSYDKKTGSYNLSDRLPGFLPRAMFSILTNEIKYADERGHSALRPSYTPWWLKQQMIDEWLSMLSKFGSPSIIATTAPTSVSQTSTDDNLNPILDASGNPIRISPEQYLALALQDLSNGSGLVLPNGATADIVYPQGDGVAFMNAVNWSNSEIVRAITLQFLATSEGMHGVRSASETHQDILSLGFNRRKRWLVTQQRKEVFKRLLMYNFDMTGKKIARYVPELNLGYGNGFPMTATEIAQIAGKYPIDPSQYDKIDAMIGLPKRDTVLVNGIPMTPSEQQERQDTIDNQAQQSDLQQQKIDMDRESQQNAMQQKGANE